MEDRLFYETSAQEVNINHMLNPDLTPENRKVLCDVISEFSVYLKKTSGRCTISKHIIECDTKIPVAGPPRSVSPQKDVIIHDPVEEMLGQRVVPSKSPYASPVHLVDKNSDSSKPPEWMFCADYRRLNVITQRDRFPLPVVEDVLTTLSQQRYFATLDLKAGFRQIEMDEESCAKTAFVTSEGLFEFPVMPFGLTNTPAPSNVPWTACLTISTALPAYGI